MARTRTTKKLAQRIDLNYFKRPTPRKRAKMWLSLLLPVVALLWIAWRGFSGDHRVYSSGRLSRAHAVLENECAACHLQKARAFSAKAADSSCLACHDGPVHHVSSTRPPECSMCHSEHRGHVNLSAASNQACAECHSDLKASHPATSYAWHINGLEDGHPEFAALRAVGGMPARDPGTIKLNHALHMKPIRRSPGGPNVQLDCGNCHRPTAADADLTYADPKYRAATVSYKDSEEFLRIHADSLKPMNPMSGRELMAPVKFANACASCHSLAFDKRFDEGVPHDKPEVVHAFLIEKFRQYIAVHPGEVRVLRDRLRNLTAKTVSPEVRILSPAQWVAERTAEAEELLWRKTCKQCHELGFPNENSSKRIPEYVIKDWSSAKSSRMSSALPYVAPANVTLWWMPHAKFDHSAHTGFTCVSCHEKALTSTEASDLLIPGIETCKMCHAPGPNHAESRCSECHTYHDWSQRKEVTPRFTLPAFRSGR